MLKGILLSMILAACAGGGRMLSNARRRRAGVLEELLAALRVLRLRMLNSMEPIGILLRKSDSALLRELGSSLWEGADLNECWQTLRERAVRRGHMLDALTEADLKLLDELFAGLGRSGREEQNNLFAEMISSLEEKHDTARRLYVDAARMYTALGALVGVGICILIV